MSIDPDAITQSIKKVGRAGTRITPGPDGKMQIEINEGGSWRVLHSGVSQKIAEDLVKKATQSVIIG